MRSLGFQPVCMSERMVRKHIATLEAAALLSRMGSNLNGTWIVDTHHELYSMYKLSENEIAFIEKMIKPME